MNKTSIIDKMQREQLKHNTLLDTVNFIAESNFNKGFLAAKKETKEIITDLFNHYNSKLKELTKPKLDRRDRTETVIGLEAKVKLLIELKKKLCQK